MRKIDIYKDRYIDLFNDEIIIRNGLAGGNAPERQKWKMGEILKFIDGNKDLFRDLEVKDEFIHVKTSKYIINIAITLSGGILFSTINLNTKKLAKPQSILQLEVLFKAMRKCLDEKTVVSYETLKNKATIHETDSNIVYLEIINEQIFKIHAKSKSNFPNSYAHEVLLSREQLLALREFLNEKIFKKLQLNQHVES